MMRILCPTDFSPASQRALRYAIEQLGGGDVEVDVLHVDDVPRHRPFEPALESSLRVSWSERLDAVVRAHEGATRLTPATRRGHAAPEILAHAAERNVSMIVMATRSRSALERLFLGGVTRKVLRNAQVPVLTLDPDARVAQLRRVLCAVDLSPGSDAVLEEAVRVAQRVGARVHLLHVHWLASEAQLVDATGFLDTRALEDLRGVAKAELGALRDRHPSAVVADARIVEGLAHAEVARAVDALEADLLVIGSHGHGGVWRFMLGSVADRLVRISPVPVLTVRAAREDLDGG
ncbi:MAG: universal stress protein [Myxococcota bacterium]|nr:universal stress protein [Myxococcota bacterium]